MAQELIINLILNKKQAEQESQAFHQGEKARIAKTLSDTEVAEKAKTEFIKRENQQRVQEAAKAQKTTIEQAREASEAQKKAAKDAADEAKRQAKAAAEDARQWSRRSLTDAEVAERAKTSLVERENRERVKAVADAARQEKAVVVGVRAAWQDSGGAVESAVASVKRYAAGMVGLQAVGAVLGAMDDRWKSISDNAMKAAEAAARMGAGHLELSGFAGTPGQTVAEKQKTANLVAESGLTMDQAAELRKAFGAGAFAIMDRPGHQGLMDPAEGERTQVMAAKLAAYSGGNAADYGKASALIPALQGRRMTADEVEGELVKMDRFATIGGYETPSDMATDLEKSSGFVKSGVISPAAAEGLLSIFAKVDKNAAATLLGQGISATSAGAIQARGMNLGDEFKEQASTTADYFKRVGIPLNTAPEVAFERISDDLAKQKAGTNLDQYLLSQGFGNQESRRAYLAFHAERATWENEIKPLMNQDIAPGTVDKTFQDHLRNDPVGRQRITDANADLAKNALGDRMMNLQQLMRNEFSILEARGQAAGSFEEYAAPDGLIPSPTRMLKGTTNNALMAPLATRITNEMNRLGLPTDLGDDNAGTRTNIFDELTGGGGRSATYKADIINNAMAQVKAAGGDPTFGGAQEMKDLAGLARRQNDLLEQIAKNTAQQQPPQMRPQLPAGRPVAPPARP